MSEPRSARPRVWLPNLLAALALLTSAGFATSSRADDSSWPRQFDSSSGSFVIYEPQPEDLSGDVLTGRAAFSLQKSGDSNPIFGVLWFTEQIQIDRDSSTVNARGFDVTKVRLPGITPAEASDYEKRVESEAAQWDLSGSLKELQSGLAATEKERASVADLLNQPPRIVVSYQRSVLVTYDGAPTLEPIEGSNLERVTNTPFAVVYNPSTRVYYLNGANVWYSAKDPLGPWTDIPRPPMAVAAVVPPDTSSDDQVQGSPPRVYTATEPTELISFDGKPQYAPLVSDQLLYVSNTECDVVREIPTQSLYVLLSGRWFRAASFDGPWTFVRGDQLPASFQKVPIDSPKGNILASVSGTDQAADAVADAEIPQTSAIQRNGASYDVSYDGDPDFEPIEGTDLRYAVNTDAEVILADGRYYACDQGVWYISDYPDGPWSVSDTRPLGVDDIPPSCPVYDTQYVYIYDVTPSVVYVGYLPGYIGCHPYYGTVVYGTGYRYRPWRGHHYYPRPCTWGYHARYNPWLSRWGFGFSYSSGFLRVGSRWRASRPSTHRRPLPLWFGPGGYRRPLLDSNLSLLRVSRTRRALPLPVDRMPANLYNRSENIVRVDRAASRMPLRPIATPVARGPGVRNNVFAGKDGKVYQRGDNGNWKVNEGRMWRPTRTPITSPRMPSGGVTAGGSPNGSVKSEARPRRSPMQPPGVERSPSGDFPRPRPTPPTISPAPGNLENEYRARKRSSEAPPLGTAAPPARRERPAPPPRKPDLPLIPKDKAPPKAKTPDERKP